MKYWFKRRRYGWGWTPVTWQGWLTIGFFMAVVIGGAMFLPETKPTEISRDVLVFLAYIAIAATILFYISYNKGPEPKWRWGKKPDDNPEEDI